VLFYFGYVSARAQYQYFGIDVDTVSLDTQHYIMRSPQPLLVPLLVLTLLGAGLLLAHTEIRRRVRTAAAATGAGDPAAHRRAAGRLRKMRRAARVAVVGGLAVLGGGIALVLGYAAVRDWAPYNLVTPLLTGTGGAIVGYAWRMADFLESVRRQPTADTAGEPSPPPAATPAGEDDSALLRRAARVLIYVLVVVSAFWATATVAQWSGRGIAQEQAQHLDRLPRVILDTKERLYLRSADIQETVLPPADGQTFHYRYRRLRLLITAQDRMFLVPESWSPSDSTLVVSLDDSVRVQFQFQNQAP
jgi:hypothetical protein